MAEFFKILKADPLGDPWTPSQPGAKPVQNYWCQVEGQDKDVSIGRQVGNPLTPGQHVYGDLTYAKSQKGNEYWKFKSVQVPEDVQRPADSPAQAQAQQAVGGNASDVIPGWAITMNNMIEYIYKEMKKMSDEPDINESIVDAGKAVADTPAEEEVKVNLDDLFGGETVPEVPEEV